MRRTLLQLLENRNVYARLDVLGRQLRDAVLAAAKRHRADLIVMGTHG